MQLNIFWYFSPFHSIDSETQRRPVSIKAVIGSFPCSVGIYSGAIATYSYVTNPVALNRDMLSTRMGLGIVYYIPRSFLDTRAKVTTAWDGGIFLRSRDLFEPRLLPSLGPNSRSRLRMLIMQRLVDISMPDFTAPLLILLKEYPESAPSHTYCDGVKKHYAWKQAG